MAENWIPLPLDKPLFANLDPDAVVGFSTAIENGFINELGGHTRFPGLIKRVQLEDNGRVYLHELSGDLIAATSKGQVYRVDRNYTAENVTSVPVGGGRRTIFAPTDRELLMAAGGPIVRLRKENKTELLSEAAPLSTHVGWIDGFTIATELNSGRFFHSPPGEPDTWDPLDTFSADGNPDNINSMLITPFRELLLGGANSVEQFERLLTGDTPFFRRWAVGDGVRFPYVQVFADNAMWTISKLTELVRFSGQTSQAASGEIGKLLEAIDDWTDAWMGGHPDSPFHILGQKFLVFQAPHATNEYGTKGITILYDYKNKRFQSLYGWDQSIGVPNRWPGWSHWKIWEKMFVGGEGCIYECTPESYRNDADLQRWLIRTSHIGEKSALQIKDFRLHIRRGLGSSAGTPPTIRVRCSRDHRPFGSWITRSLGRAGERSPYIYFGGFGNGSTFQFEISSSSDCPIDLIGADVLAMAIGH
jgi:hypothetical protein